MIVVSDTSPLSYLILIEQVEVLPKLYGKVLAPPAVVAELQHVDAPATVRAWASGPPEWLQVQAPAVACDFGMLGAGEAAALQLAVEIGADLVLIDERAATIVARRNGFRTTGTLGTLILAAERNLLSLTKALAALRRTTFRATPELLDRIEREHGPS
ncbi:MAG: DUF3368 domain-containing protein [Phycisphaerae bacterium]